MKVYRFRTAALSEEGVPHTYFCGAFEWNTVYHLHVLNDVREGQAALNSTGSHPVTGRRHAQWGKPLVDMVGLSGGFAVKRIWAPEWWTRTEAEARAMVGL